ncbi:MAG: pentapeptide repeat-containing protein [Nostoc sp.]|uniref:pentapeptide repeat-containing protein n=1 Tax=Nostoc sp. TaxID=1180 RepID=UPI002FF8EA33
MERERVTLEEFLRRYAAGERDFQQILLEYADLSGVELQGINLDGAQFCYVNLSSIKLGDCNLKAQFIYCNFRDALIENCDLECTRFFDCDLRGATLRYVELTSSAFTRVNLQGTKTYGSGKDPCEFWDVIREDGVFVPGFTFDLYIAERIAERKTKGDDVF